ncbi:uncharacterized protein [Amphiura filiformis]|uniref:uncharacterized protein n=1 Tax=Amphiura filiformis TaxID=82378 RepID=UPI003B216921
MSTVESVCTIKLLFIIQNRVYFFKESARDGTDGSDVTLAIIIGATTIGVVLILVIGVVYYKGQKIREENPEFIETPECEPYALYRPPMDDSSQHPTIDISDPEHHTVSKVPYFTDVPPPYNSSPHPPTDSACPKLAGLLPVSYFTCISPDDSSAHPHVNAPGYEIPIRHMRDAIVGDDVTVTTEQDGYIEVIA